MKSLCICSLVVKHNKTKQNKTKQKKHVGPPNVDIEQLDIITEIQIT